MSKIPVTSTELDAWAEEAAKQIKAEQDKIIARNKELIDSGEFKTLFAKLKEHLEANDTVVNRESLAYETDPFSKVINYETFDLIESCAGQLSETKEDPTADWETDGFIYEGVCFVTVYGQGSITTARIATEEQVKKFG